MTAQTSPLLAALDAIEETARRAIPGPWESLDNGDRLVAWRPHESGFDDDLEYVVDEPIEHGPTAAHIALHDPAFTLRLVEGLREVVALHGPDTVEILTATGIAVRTVRTCPNCRQSAPCPTLAALTRALVGEEER